MLAEIKMMIRASFHSIDRGCPPKLTINPTTILPIGELIEAMRTRKSNYFPYTKGLYDIPSLAIAAVYDEAMGAVYLMDSNFDVTLMPASWLGDVNLVDMKLIDYGQTLQIGQHEIAVGWLYQRWWNAC